MSFRATFPLKNLSKSLINNVLTTTRSFSRRSVGSDGSYKYVKGRKAEKEDKTNLAWRDPNIDILTSPSFPFFMPGNISPAWYDSHTTVQNVGSFSMNQIEKVAHNSNILCRAQTCPEVFRKTVCELFPHRNLEQSDLSVITITLKPDIKTLRRNKEIETEKLAQSFVITAKNVCTKLRKAGYWADFINPFSGLPYFSSSAGGKELYNTDEKFRCMDFEIFKVDNCTIISNENNGSNKRSFVGSLFTNAPSKQNELNEIFTK